MASTIKVTNIDTPDSTGNITVDRPLAGSGASLTALNATQLTTGTIPIARIADDAVTLAKMADDAIGVAQLSATGTASNTTFLRGDNAWAAAGGGKVLQVVEGTTTTQTSTTSTSYVASDLSVTITPSATSSKILVTASAPINANDTTSADIGGAWTIYRDSTDLISNGGDTFYSSLAQNYAGLMMLQKLDSPNSTSALVYKVYLKSTQSGTTMKNCHNNSMGVITAVEIGA